MNSLRYMLTPFITVTCITEQELPRSECPSEYMIIAIEGLYPNENTYLRNKAMGYLSFIRTGNGDVNDNTSEHTNFDWYRKIILLPFINLFLTSYCEHDNNIPIPYELTAVCWCDGDQTQLNVITDTSNQKLDATNKIMILKQCRGIMVVEQTCGVCPVFRLFRAIAKTATKENFSSFLLLDKLSNYFLVENMIGDYV